MQFGGYKIFDQHNVHFLTFTVVDWIDVFTRPVYKDILVNTLDFYQASRGIVVYGYVIMTNHVHLLLQSPTGKLSDFIRDYKRWTSAKIRHSIAEESESRRAWIMNRLTWRGITNNRNKDFQLWFQGNHPIAVVSLGFAWQKLDYIHQNPVKAGIVRKAEDYVYSSAYDYSGGKGPLRVELLEMNLK